MEVVLERTRQLPPLPIHKPPPVDQACEELQASPDELIASAGRAIGLNLPRCDSEVFWQELSQSLDEKSSRDSGA